MHVYPFGWIFSEEPTVFLVLRRELPQKYSFLAYIRHPKGTSFTIPRRFSHQAMKRMMMDAVLGVLWSVGKKITWWRKLQKPYISHTRWAASRRRIPTKFDKFWDIADVINGKSFMSTGAGVRILRGLKSHVPMWKRSHILGTALHCRAFWWFSCIARKI